MAYPARCPAPATVGGDCWEEPHPASRHGLCVTHWQEIVEDWAADAPRTTRSCPRCYVENCFDPIDWPIARCGRCGTSMSDPSVLLGLAQARESAERDRVNRRVSVIYYVRFGDMVKIGVTTNLAGRMKVIPHDTILALEPGDTTQERARHREFESLLVDGQREWFHAAPDLMRHVEMLRVRHGVPKQVIPQASASFPG